ncbi:hypothetical protein H8356DRAFT_1679247 [Neocallimastix lanati (nom. inval.)]|jgi:hypothetical protein|uniref:Uncharacterized protein n=1 Tax=Neocallimastix californiae TaxID=1754190 RepID=A0A1Y2CT03_9FUNG|nr:hypothetical protein H8356DRAFT_1679247 [Neocallimastix sp. JGI-2020a]ORY50141.1 hypothetical protein LY90DRAFT_508550 [Neocallimastix californiae]|eukprot:ORY50141.1 hypothetical protein LY90DRAFT_508550 [Neocallimastix californiae]
MGSSFSKPPDSYSTYISENIQYGERPKTCYNIEGFLKCAFYRASVDVSKDLLNYTNNENKAVEKEYYKKIENIQNQLKELDNKKMKGKKKLTPEEIEQRKIDLKLELDEIKAKGIVTEPKNNIQFRISTVSEEDWDVRVRQLRKLVPDAKELHTNSPFIYKGCNRDEYQFIGGFRDFMDHLRVNYWSETDYESHISSGRFSDNSI